MEKEITRRKFIKASALGIAATTLCPVIMKPGNAFGTAPTRGYRMFCYQCEQTSDGTGCTTVGICGKSPTVAALHDLLIYSLKGLAVYAVAGRQKGIEDKEVNRFIPMAAFSTLTNVDFDPERQKALIHEAFALREGLRQKVASAGGSPEFTDGPVNFKPASTINELVDQGRKVGLKSDTSIDPDLLSLQHTLLFGLKGLSAYVDHARDLGQEDNEVYHFVQDGLVATMNKKLGMDDLLGLVLSWYEQKAVAILLTLFALNIKDIRLGPSLPAFITPNVLNVLVKNYNIMPIKTPDEDLKAILA